MATDEYKQCSICKQTLPLSEFFVRRASPDSLSYRCKACSSIIRHAHYEAKEKDDPIERAKNKQRGEAWWQRHKDEPEVRSNALERGRKYYHAHKDEDDFKERKTRKDKKYYDSHAEEIIASTKRYAKENKEYLRPFAIEAQNRRRAKKNSAEKVDLTRAQWEVIKAIYDYRCVYCGKKSKRLTQDHITPISKGGNHTASNVVPACGSCNSKKGTKAPLKPVQPILEGLQLAPEPKEKP